MSRIPFPLRSGSAPFRFMGQPRLVNVYPEAIGDEQKSPVAFLSIPGQEAWAEPTDVPSRAMLACDDLGFLYSLHLSTLYKVDDAGAETAIGGVIPGSSPAVMVRNAADPVQLTIVSDATTWVLDTDADTFTQVVHPVAESANGAALIGGRMVYSYPSGLFAWTDINDATTIESVLDYATAERVPDGLVGCFEDHGELWLPGPRSVEVWTTSDDINLPFRPLGGSYINVGCGSRDSMISFDNAVHYLGVDGVYYRASGYSSAQRISDHAVERAIAELGADLSSVRAFTYSSKGHAFLGLTCSLWTWVFDAATQKWAERKSYQHDDWRAWPHAFAFGMNLCGDKESGEIRRLDDAIYEEVGQPIRCELTLPDIDFGFKRAIFDELNIDLNTGQGLGGVPSTTSGYDPQVMLDWSDDGGYTFSNERTQSVGREGQYFPGVIFRRMGACDRRGRRYRVAFSDPVPRGFSIADIRARVGRK